MSEEHTEEPWVDSGWDNFNPGCLEPQRVIKSERGSLIAFVYSDSETWDAAKADITCIANARRIVACVNALKGVPTEELKGLNKPLREAIDTAINLDSAIHRLLTNSETSLSYLRASIRHVLTLLPDRPEEARGWLEECLR